ncbi:unnamed protein product [Haemonchus placei]|uniref:PPM-type phosphatase domain-containing protein n=1 Tax=Haemonchus placei TaxID=6290 RepID=A0A0N4VZV5_HAEPC|nr:unnamed protein product [Haemonchus placei]
MGGAVTSVAFCPIGSKSLVAVAHEGHQISILNTNCGDKLVCSQTEELIREVPIEDSDGKVKWRRIKDRIVIEMPNVGLEFIRFHNYQSFLLVKRHCIAFLLFSSFRFLTITIISMVSIYLSMSRKDLLSSTVLVVSYKLVGFITLVALS